jgi:cell division FtsZ-interacting protein ZapD
MKKIDLSKERSKINHWIKVQKVNKKRTEASGINNSKANHKMKASKVKIYQMIKRVEQISLKQLRKIRKNPKRHNQNMNMRQFKEIKQL